MTLAIAVRLLLTITLSYKDLNFAAKDLIQHLLCVDPSHRYTIDEFLAHPWCNAAPAPPPPPTPRLNGDIFHGQPLDSPLLSAARGRIREGKSPGIATLKEAFDITYAVHRMEEENARRRRYNNRGLGGFLSKLNEGDEEDEEEIGSSGLTAPAQLLSIKDGRAASRDQAPDSHGSSRRRHVRGNKEFELDLRGATLLGRRHKKGVNGGKSPLSGQPLQAEHAINTQPGDEYGGSTKNPVHP
jgi:serine/threonine protein kinase